MDKNYSNLNFEKIYARFFYYEVQTKVFSRNKRLSLVVGMFVIYLVWVYLMYR